MTTRISEAARSLAEARAAVVAALAVLHDTVRAEVAAGMSAVEAAREAGVSRQQVYNIVRSGDDAQLEADREWLGTIFEKGKP